MRSPTDQAQTETLEGLWVVVVARVLQNLPQFSTAAFEFARRLVCRKHIPQDLGAAFPPGSLRRLESVEKRRHHLLAHLTGKDLGSHRRSNEDALCGLRRLGLDNGRGFNRRGYRGVLAALAQFALQPTALALQAVSFANRRNVCFALVSQLSFEFGDPLVRLGFLLRDGVQSGILRTPRSRPLRGRSSTWGLFQRGF